DSGKCLAEDMEMRIRRSQVERNSVVIYFIYRLDRAIRLVGPIQARILFQHIVGKDHVIRRKGLSIAPGNAVAELDRQSGVIRIVLVARGEPGDILASLKVLV